MKTQAAREQENPQGQRVAVCPLCWRTVEVDPTQRTYLPHNNPNKRGRVQCLASGRALRSLFSLGQVVSTPGALEALEQAGQRAEPLLDRHRSGDWGEVPPEDARQNLVSVRLGYRILSAYTLSTGVKLWIISEADRSATTLLLPAEY